MNIYTVSIDLKDDAKALGFAHAVCEWMSLLKGQDVILDFRLLRRKLNLADRPFRDFLLEIAVNNLDQLDRAFRVSGSQDEDINQLYRAVHSKIHHAEFGLYRPFPDPERVERMGLL